MITLTTPGGSEHKVKRQGDDLLLDGHPVNWDMIKTGTNRYHVLMNDKSFDAELLTVDEESKKVIVKINNKTIALKAETEYDLLLKKLGLDKAISKKVNELKAPMPGLVLKILVTEGQLLKPGDSILVLEAMKMENVLKCTGEATIKSIKVKPGDKVEKNQLLVVMN